MDQWMVFVREDHRDIPLFIGDRAVAVATAKANGPRVALKRATPEAVALYQASWYQDKLDEVWEHCLGCSLVQAVSGPPGRRDPDFQRAGTWYAVNYL